MGNCVCNGHSAAADHPHHRKLPSSSSSTSSSSHHHHHHHHQAAMMIKVVTSNGGIMELYAPITADQITSEFPGHALFRSPDPTHPLRPNDRLHPGQLYYLLPLTLSNPTTNNSADQFSQATPYRMSFDTPRVAHKRASAYPDPTPKNGVWKVRLVINPEQLSEILSQEAKTEELIGSVRTVAKCGGGSGGASTSSAASSDSDQRSVSSCSFKWKNSL